MKTYILTVKHDQGREKIKIAASNLKTAVQLLTSAAACPPWAIIKTQKVKA